MYRRITIGAFCFGAELSAFPPRFAATETEPPGILIYSFGAFGEVDLRREIEGADDCVKRLTERSAEADCAVFCGVSMDIFGTKKDGAVICNKGVLVDIADRSNTVKVFATEKGNVGLLLTDDCVSERHWAKLAPESDVILCLAHGTEETVREDIRLFSAAYKIPYLVLDGEGVEWKG